MYPEPGGGGELYELWKRASDREKIGGLVMLGAPALGIGLVGIIAGLRGAAVLFGLPGILMILLAIAIGRKRQIQKVITPRWYGLLGKGIIGGIAGGAIGFLVGMVVGGNIENIGAALGISIGFAVGIGIAHLWSKF